MTHSIVVEPKAEQELRAARRWYETRREGLGRSFLDDADDALKRLAAMPGASSLVPNVSPELGVRRVFLRQFPYAIVFIEEGPALIVIAFAHLRRRPGYWTSRLGNSDP